MNSNPDDVRDRLERITKQLAKLSFPTSPIKADDAHWLAKGIDDFLEGNHNSLDAALGLKRKRGAPETQTKKKELIARAWSSKPDMTWQKLAEFVHLEYPRIFTVEPDEKEIRRAIGGKVLKQWTPHAIEALGDEISRRLERNELIFKAFKANPDMNGQKLAQFLHRKHPRIFTAEPDEKEIRDAISKSKNLD